TSPPAPERSTRSLAHAGSTARPSSPSTSSTAWSSASCGPCNARHPPSLASAEPTSCRSSPRSHPQLSQDTSVACASSACSNASTEPIATTSPESGALLSQPAHISPRTFSFQRSHDNSAHKKTRVVSQGPTERWTLQPARSCERSRLPGVGHLVERL